MLFNDPITSWEVVSWTGDPETSIARYEYNAPTGDLSFKGLALGYEALIRLHLASIVLTLGDEPFKDLLAELVEIIKFYYRPIEKVLPDPEITVGYGLIS